MSEPDPCLYHDQGLDLEVEALDTVRIRNLWNFKSNQRDQKFNENLFKTASKNHFLKI
jgi:hypothetical protein